MQPNYIATVSGSTQGVTGDSNTDLSAVNIADRLEAAGITWGAYAEGLDTGCDTAARVGAYARKHEPFISFKSISGNKTRCSSHIHPASQFASDLSNGNLPQYVFFTPDMNDDGHDTNTTYAGKWMNNFMNKYNDFFQSTNTVVQLTFDETETYSAPNSVYSVILGGAVDDNKVGTTDSANYNHYSFLRTIEANWNLASMQSGDANATPFDGVRRDTTLCG